MRLIQKHSQLDTAHRSCIADACAMLPACFIRFAPCTARSCVDQLPVRSCVALPTMHRNSIPEIDSSRRCLDTKPLLEPLLKVLIESLVVGEMNHGSSRISAGPYGRRLVRPPSLHCAAPATRRHQPRHSPSIRAVAAPSRRAIPPRHPAAPSRRAIPPRHPAAPSRHSARV